MKTNYIVLMICLSAVLASCEDKGNSNPNEDNHSNSDIYDCGAQHQNCTNITGWSDGICQDGICIIQKCTENMHVYHNSCETDTQEHCGEHDRICSEKQTCSSGQCKCKDSFMLCSEECIDIKTDSNHCGGCNHACQSEHASQTECQNGECRVLNCEDNYHVYNNLCEPDDVAHCGVHDVDCAVKMSGWKKGTCVGGQCSASECEIGYHLDNNQCIEDTNACCGSMCSTCDAGKVCSNGECKNKCDSPLIYCDNSCVNHLSNNSHCGACNTPCNALSIQNAKEANCNAGQCLLTECLDGFHQYQNTCEPDDIDNCGTHNYSCAELVDGWKSGECKDKTCVIWKCKEGFHLSENVCVADTPENCGDTGINCLNETGVADASCTNGQCEILKCKSGFHIFGSKCESDDNQHCGEHESACSEFEECSKGECVCKEDYIRCGGVCIDKATNMNHCGKCDSPCSVDSIDMSSEVTCQAGQCIVTACADNAHIYNNKCAANDNQHCGSHESACGEFEECSKGECVCKEDYIRCGGVCIDKATNMNHCGKCDSPCSVDSIDMSSEVTCQAGQCIVTACADNAHIYNNKCAANDNQHCGSHESACGEFEECSGGHCEPISIAATCGNGILETGEVCDDNNVYDGDGCSADCKTVEDGYHCLTEGDPCVVAACGDNIVDEYEDCDFGDPSVAENMENYGIYGLADGGIPLCNPITCKYASYCGDGLLELVDTEYGEECDSGGVDLSQEYNGCSAECRITFYCGDSKITHDEKCDDGNKYDGDGCSSDCVLEDGFSCIIDDGKSICQPLKCGNGVLDEGETCDDGNRNAGDGCSMICLVERLWHCATSSDGKSVCINTCGNSVLDTDTGEYCDDGNKNDGDGCSSACAVEFGYSCDGTACVPNGYYCQPPAGPCVLDTCGNGFVGPNEICDGKSGCGADCHSVTSGYCFSASKGLHYCSTKTCGNYILEYGEECDDGNTLGGDGCSDLCTVEYAFECPTGIECRPICGDGIIMRQMGEECDDGNLINGDGCTVDCKIEHGFTCSDPTMYFPDAVNLDVTYRDFVGRNLSSGNGLVNSTVYNELSSSDCRRTMQSSEPANFKSQINGKVSDLVPGAAWLKQGYGFPDFEGFAGNLCFGLVKNELDSEGKPVFNGSLNDNCCGNMSSTQCSAFLQGGTYDGATYPKYVGGTTNGNWHHVSKLSKRHHMLCAESFAKWYRTDNVVSKEYKTTLPLTKEGDTSKYVFNSDKPPYNEYFSPIDGQGWNEKNPLAPNNHNGSFTTEISTMFQYKGGETLNFSGDDDVWVFINGKLFLDVGGMHAKVEGQNTLSTKECTSQDKKNGGTVKRVCDEKYKIYKGGIYELKVFHAERAASGADFKLTLDGFVNSSTVTCSSVCGDGIIRGNEECDPVAFANPAAPTAAELDMAKKLGCVSCQLQAYCGNGKIEKGEQCDDMAEWCVNCKLPYCGNNELDEHEECDGDKGLSAGQTCLENCRIAGCGDGTVGEGEECDDGNTSDDDMCTNHCTSPVCGDGIVTFWLGEVCDDGINDGSYNGCGLGCSYLSPHCGDAIIDTYNGEECDDGVEYNVGNYGGCTWDCKRAPYCGDGIVQPEYEQCDGTVGCSSTCTMAVN